jgi:hypothetical protein
VIVEGSTNFSRRNIFKFSHNGTYHWHVWLQTCLSRRRLLGVTGCVGNAQGTLDDELSTVNGHPFTVMSDGSLVDVRQIPREVYMAGGQTDPLASQPSNGKRVKIFVVPGWDKGFSMYCFQFIGQGASFYTTQNCTTAHHHVRPGELYVAKSQ